MDSKIKIVLSVAAMSLVMVGCGGGSGSSGDSGTLPQVDNSPYLENQYGYFGDGVIFGSTLVTGNWTNKAMYNGVEETVIIGIYSDGEMIFTNTNNGLSFDTDYGVSQDGATMRTGLGDTIQLQSSLGNNCYSVLLTNINKEGSLSAELCKNN